MFMENISKIPLILLIITLFSACSNIETTAGAVFDNANDAIEATTNDEKLWDNGVDEEEESS